jgi:Na+/proline symporter
VVSGLLFSRTGTNVIELVNLIGSVFYGPVLGVFTLGILAPGVGSRQALAGLAAGFVATLLVAVGVPGLSWMWWSAIGWLVTVLAALVLTRQPIRLPRPAGSRREAWLLGGAFAIMLGLLVAL